MISPPTAVLPESPVGTEPAPSGGGAIRVFALLIGALLVIASIGYGCLTLVALVDRRDGVLERHLTTAITRVAFDASGVGISITGGGTAGRADVRTTVDWSWGTPRLTTAVLPDGTLKISLHCARWAPIGCRGNMRISLPSNVAVTGSSSGGGITADGLRGSLRLDSSGGGITVRHIVGSVSLDSSGGGVTAEDVTGDLNLGSSGGGVRGFGLRSDTVTADSSGGGVHLEFLAAPMKLLAGSSGGGVTVLVPAGSGPYRVDADSSGGGVHRDVASDARSPRLLYVRSSGGGVNVGYLSS